MSKSASQLSESIVNKAIEALNWDGLNVHLGGLVLDEASAERLIGLVLRSRSLVFRYPGKTIQRATLIDGVVAKIRANLGDNAADNAKRRLAIFEVIDEGYTGLRTLISKLPLAASPKAEMTSAYLAYVARNWAELRRQVEEASTQPQVAGSIIVSMPNGHRFGADAMTSSLVNLLGMNVMLAAYEGKWFDRDGLLRLPNLPEVKDVDVPLAGEADGTAFAWQQWQLIEERCRYFGGALTRRPATEADEVPASSIIIEHEPEMLGWEMLDTVANERLGDRLRQTFQDMWIKTNISTMGLGIVSGAPMPPVGYVSPLEIHSAVMLSDYLGINVATHSADLGGLRLCEWLRGFAVLQQLANDKLADGEAEAAAFPRVGVSDLVTILERNGLANGAARRFIDHASFSKSSRDLFDAPIIRGVGDWCLLVVPALSEALLFRLVLSALANKRLDVVGKGEAFEEKFRSSLRAQGLSVYSFEAQRDGETYEYDAIVPWGRYLFVFECKNRALSGTNPIASFNFIRSVTEHIEQVQRLVGALAKYPDILTCHLTEDCSVLTVVPVVMSSMPFSVDGEIMGVYFSDAAAIHRFFQERFTHTIRLHEVGGTKVMHRVPTHSQWAGDEPTADDFMHQFGSPLQLRILSAHMALRTIGFQIGPSLYACTRVPSREETTIASMAETAGLSAEAIEDEMDRVAKEVIEPLRASVERGMDDGESGPGVLLLYEAP